MEIARLNDNTLIFVEFGLDVSGVVCFTDGITEWLGEEAETGSIQRRVNRRLYSNTEKS